MNLKDPFTSQIKNIVSTTFNEYFDHCSNYDEYRPETGECLNQYGFSSTIFESLDTLYLLGLKKEFEKAKTFIKEKVKIGQMQWINRREFWSRCIGSLLSAYIMTTDSFFLSKATELSKAMLSISLTSPFVNFAEKSCRNHQWIKGTSLSDIVAGLPELFTLHKLTNDESYSLAYLTILNSIPTFSNNSIFNFFDLDSKNENPVFRRLDRNVVDFYHILSIAYSIKPINSLKKKLASLLNFIDLNDDDKICIFSHFSPLHETISIIEKNGIEIENLNNFSIFFDASKKIFKNKKFVFELNCSSKYSIPFRFDASLLRSFVKKANDNENDVINDVFNIVNESFTYCKLKKGFSGLLKINSGEVIKINIQHSSFFGQWMSLTSLLLSDQKNIIKNGVFNECGHLLYSNLMFPDEED